MIISLDTECTGLDLAHGAKPYLVTIHAQGWPNPVFWEWDVDPLTRQPRVDEDDLPQIAELMDAAEVIYLQSAKYDGRALATIGLQLPWEKVRDTLCMGHLLASNHPHNLTDMCMEYLDADIEPLELTIKEVTRLARDIVRRQYPSWKIAKEGEEGMPSVSGSSKRDEDKPWKNDMWLPKALISADPSCALSPRWHTACSDYACGDSEHTLYLGMEMERRLRSAGLDKIHLKHRVHLPRIASQMEGRGVTTIGEYTQDTIGKYEEYVAEAADALVEMAKQYNHKLELAEGASLNDNMREFFYGSVILRCPKCTYVKHAKHWNGDRVEDGATCPKCAKKKRAPEQCKLWWANRGNLAMPVISNKSGGATLDKNAMQEYLLTGHDKAKAFVRTLMDKREHDTHLTYMRGYRRFWVPILDRNQRAVHDYYRIHASFNPFGTDHLRWASSSPNLQNVGKQEQRCKECDGDGCDACGGTGMAMLSMRYCFGPAPGREWYSADYESIEKRVPAYECREPALIEIFEKPNEPPYWGSDHNLLCSLLWPDKYYAINNDPKVGPVGTSLHLIKGAFKSRYINEYKRGKNTNFAKQYGAGKRKVDLTAGVRGAFDLIDRGMPLLAALQADYLRRAEKTGYVETLPDRTVDPDRGYPILASRTDDGRVLSTTPFNYHVSGTACWIKNRALVDCDARLEEWRQDGFDGYICLEVHDEIVFDFPRGPEPTSNEWRARELRGIMARVGDDLVPRIPTPVSLSRHDRTWAEEVTIK